MDCHISLGTYLVPRGSEAEARWNKGWRRAMERLTELNNWLALYLNHNADVDHLGNGALIFNFNMLYSGMNQSNGTYQHSVGKSQKNSIHTWNLFQQGTSLHHFSTFCTPMVASRSSSLLSGENGVGGCWREEDMRWRCTGNARDCLVLLVSTTVGTMADSIWASTSEKVATDIHAGMIDPKKPFLSSLLFNIFVRNDPDVSGLVQFSYMLI